MVNKNNNQEPQVDIATAVSKSEKFINENKKTIIWSAVGVIVIAALIVLYKYAYSEPRMQEATDQAYAAEMLFAGGEFEKALNGDENTTGLAEVIDEYGSKAPHAVFFEAGVCALQLGKWDEALDYLNRYKGTDPIMKARATTCKGDAYSAKEDYSKAASLYMDAADCADNILAASYLMKAGIVYEQMGENEKALDAYNAIKVKYPQSIEGYEIDKYIERISTK